MSSYATQGGEVRSGHFARGGGQASQQRFQRLDFDNAQQHGLEFRGVHGQVSVTVGLSLCIAFMRYSTG